MKLSDFQLAINGGISFSDFFLKIKSEVKAYKELISSGKKGIAVPVYLEEDVGDLELTAKDVKRLGWSFLNKEISIYELSYLADVLSLSETVSYDNEKSKEAIYSFTDSDINGEITFETVQKIIADL